jgi:hypothetical protein
MDDRARIALAPFCVARPIRPSDVEGSGQPALTVAFRNDRWIDAP